MPEKLSLLVRCGHPLISVETADEERGVRLVRKVAAELSDFGRGGSGMRRGWGDEE